MAACEFIGPRPSNQIQAFTDNSINASLATEALGHNGVTLVQRNANPSLSLEQAELREIPCLNFLVRRTRCGAALTPQLRPR
jgi:hypothetical protein